MSSIAGRTAGRNPRVGARGFWRRLPEFLGLMVKHPTLFLALGGVLGSSAKVAIELYDARRTGIPSVSVAQVAERQTRLATAHNDCAYALPTRPVSGRPNLLMGAGVCENGDVAIVSSNANGTRVTTWFVPLNTVRREHEDATWQDAPVTMGSFLPSLIGSAHANEIAAPQIAQVLQLAGIAQTNVVCQRVLDKGRLLRGIRTPGGCFDEVVNTFNGQVISSIKVACTPNCG